MDEIRKFHRVLIGVSAFAGLVAMSYLTYIHFSGITSFCDVAAGLSCDAVTGSIYSEVFGIPVSILGILYFTTALSISLSKSSFQAFRFLFLLTAFVIAPSLYLTAMEIFFIKSFCILCETSKIMMFFILGLSYAAIKSEDATLSKIVAPIVVAGIVISGIIYLLQTSTIFQ